MITHNESYCREILEQCGGPGTFDHLEIHGVRDLPEVNAVTPTELDDDHPEYFSVYLHYGPGEEQGGLECIGDFTDHATALTYAQLLSKRYHWPVHDHLTPR